MIVRCRRKSWTLAWRLSVADADRWRVDDSPPACTNVAFGTTMRSHRMVPLLAVASLVTAASAQSPPRPPIPSNPMLARISARVDSIRKRQPFDFAAFQATTDSLRPILFGLIERDSLRTGGDFLVTSSLIFDPTGFFENRRVEHEMALAALVLGEPGAISRVGFTWDGVNLSMGFGQRIGSYMRDGVPTDMDPAPAPGFVRAVFKDFDAARRRAVAATDHAELKSMRDADQADREPPMDEAKMQRLARDDPKRRARVLELIAAGVPATGRDFQNAATVLQHGGRPKDFRLGHELSVAAFALGDTTATWLISRSYDRLLLHLGHRQRLATQFRGIKLLPIDTVGTNDRVRALLGGRRLVDVRAGDHP
jgi:hypothetical protein